MNITVPKTRRAQVLILLPWLLFWGSIQYQPTAAASTYLRVATSGNDGPTCGTESSPCRSLQYTLNKAATGDIITVAGGNYTYNAGADNCTFLTTRAVACFVDKHLTILGGYSTDNWGIANPSQNLTVIDGQNTWRGVAVIAYNTTASLHMEGFTIQNGLAQGTSGGEDFLTFAFGGGLWSQCGSVVLKNMTFKNNRALGGSTGQAYGGAAGGGGLAIQSSKNSIPSQLENVKFEGNQAMGGAGAQRGGVAIGGALFTYEAILNGDGLLFTNNKAQAGNSAGNGLAGGLRADALGGAMGFQINSQAHLSRVEAYRNQAIGGNAGTGADAVGGGGFAGALSAERASLTLNDAVLRDNSAQGGLGATGGTAYGGGFLIDTTPASLDRVTVIKNAAISGGSTTNGNAGSPLGGGGYFTGWGSSTPPSAKVSNSIFADNWVQLGTPGINKGGYAGGLGVQAMTVDVSHSTFAANYFVGGFSYGQAISVICMWGTSGTPGVLNLSSSIVSDHVNTYTNTSAITVSLGSTLNLYRGLFAGNTNDTNSNSIPVPSGTITGLSTMIRANAVHYKSPGSPDFNYHLQPTSPAVDQALSQNLSFGTAEDIDGQSRPYGSAADIGADEYMPPSLETDSSQLTVLTDQDQEIIRTLTVHTSDGSMIDWEASTAAPWIFLGPAGTSQTASGRTGEDLVVRFAPGQVGLGDYYDLITISSPAAASSLMVNTRLFKVDQLFTVYLPVIRR